MKKIILSACLLMGGLSLFAQNSTNAPDNIRRDFDNTYQGASNVTWETVTLPVFTRYSNAAAFEPPMQGWRATYVKDNRLIHVYYTDRVKSYTVALPTLQTYVPEDVITKATNMYGNNIYDISMVKNAMNVDVYHVRVQDNGTMTSAWINEDGSMASTTDIYVTK